MMTLTRERGFTLIEYLRDIGPQYTTWGKVGTEVGFPWAIHGVVATVRRNPVYFKLVRIPFIELGPKTHWIGAVWKGMPPGWARAALIAQIVSEEQQDCRLETSAAVNDIINETLKGETRRVRAMARESAEIAMHHRMMPKASS